MGHLKLRANLAFLLQATIVVVLLLVGVRTSLHLGHVKEVELEINRRERDLKLIENSLDVFVGKLVSDVNFMGKSPILRQFVDDSGAPGNLMRGQQALLTLAEIRPDYAELAFLDAKGQTLIQALQDGQSLELVLGDQPDHSGREATVRQALQLQPWQVLVSDIEHLKSGQFPLGVYAVSPVFVDEQLRGLVMIGANGQAMVK